MILVLDPIVDFVYINSFVVGAAILNISPLSVDDDGLSIALFRRVLLPNDDLRFQFFRLFNVDHKLLLVQGIIVVVIVVVV